MHTRSDICGNRTSRVHYTSTKGTVLSCGSATVAVCQRENAYFVSVRMQSSSYRSTRSTGYTTIVGSFLCSPHGVRLVTSLTTLPWYTHLLDMHEAETASPTLITPSSSPCSAKVILPPALRVAQQKSIEPRDRVTESRSIFTIPQAPSWICCAEHSPTSQQPSAERHRDTAQTPRCHGMPAPPLMPPSTRASL